MVRVDPTGFVGKSRIALALLVLLLAQQTSSADDAIPADAPARWWKGNLHTHTLWSDGDDFPEMVAEWYRTHGYHFLGLSDHNILAEGRRWKSRDSIVKKGGPTVVDKYLARYGASWVETRGKGDDLEIRLKPLDEFRALVEERGKFLMIPAEEISDKVDGAPLHINASNLREAVQPLGGATMTEAITNNLRNVQDQAERSGREILAHLNHPNFGFAVTAEDLAHAVVERHFEVYNGHPGVNQLGDDHHPSIDRMWDICNTIRLVDLKAAPLFGLATDDSHNYHGKPKASHPGRGWVMVRSTHLTPEYIVRAIQAGDFYASSGVTLTDVRFDAATKMLELAIEPDGDAEFTTQFIGSLRGVDSTGTPVLDPPAEPKSTAGKTGEAKPTRRSHKYSDEIGKVIATSSGLKARYVLTGQELYVRALVTSSRAAADPSFEGQKQQAWTQPVGWEVPPPKKTDATKPRE